MRNVKIIIEYDGTGYCGWQRQGRRKSIQRTIENALRKILRKNVRLSGSGRTDSGVHAKGQVANFRMDSKIGLWNLQRALNSYLPDGIVIKDIKEANLDFHSRFDAKAKEYRYTILNDKFVSPFDRRFVYHFPYNLDLNLMKKEAKVLLGEHDFKAFQATDKIKRLAIRNIRKLNITKRGKFIFIDVEADGFLYNMVRNIVGTLIEIGRGKFAEGSMKKILHSKNRKFAGQTAPAKGLCLMRVKY